MAQARRCLLSSVSCASILSSGKKKKKKSPYPVLFICCQQLPPSTRVLLTDIDWLLLVKLYAGVRAPRQPPTPLCLLLSRSHRQPLCFQSAKRERCRNPGPYVEVFTLEKRKENNEKEKGKSDLKGVNRFHKVHQFAYIWVWVYLFVCGSAVTALLVQKTCLSIFLL